ncbi:cell surface glycoprotein [Streptomyces sp. NPDC058220]|uniref:zinc finger domain-containing protein n=1 Tax=Streptomyces sp. NPDC058220 TaxID=3346387 RepID=UPI0036E6940A
MTPDEIPLLLKQVSYADPRVLPEDPAEVMGLAALWATVLADVPTEYAMRAVGQHYAKSPFPIKPSDISTRWQSVVRDRMNRHTGTFEPTAHPQLDPDDVAGYQAALLAERQAVVLGEQPPTELAAITAGPAAEEVERRMAELGSYMPPSVAEVLRRHRPIRAERERTIRAGLPDPLAVDCPVETCRAYAGRPCTRPGKGGARHALTAGAHPSRTEAATTAMKPAPAVPAPAST